MNEITKGIIIGIIIGTLIITFGAFKQYQDIRLTVLSATTYDISHPEKWSESYTNCLRGCNVAIVLDRLRAEGKIEQLKLLDPVNGKIKPLKKEKVIKPLSEKTS